MFESLFQKGALPLIESSALFSFERHKVISNNIANISTPGYKAQDLPVEEFNKMLSDALQNAHNTPVTFSSSSNIRIKASKPQFNLIDSPESGIIRENGNNVDPEAEGVKMIKNALHHEIMTQLLRHQYQMLRSSVSTRR